MLGFAHSRLVPEVEGKNRSDDSEAMMIMSVENLFSLNLWLAGASSKSHGFDGLALASHNPRPGQSRQKAVILARLGPAYVGLAWPGSRPEAGPGTALPILKSARTFSNVDPS